MTQRATNAADPLQLAREAVQKGRALARAGRDAILLLHVNRALARLEPLATPEVRAISDLRRPLGELHNLRGVAAARRGQLGAAAEAFERAQECGIDHGRFNLMDLCCYYLGDYQRARRLSRFPTNDDAMWYRKVKADGLASLMLGDAYQAERCYHLLQRAYLRRDDAKLELARRELEVVAGDRGASVLQWLGVKRQVSAAELADWRRWWDGLEPNWHKQLRVALVEGRERAVRQRAARARKALDDEALLAVTELERIKLRRDYPVRSLEPLTRLGALRELSANRCEWLANLDEEIGRLPRLARLELEGSPLRDLGALSSLTQLELLVVSAAEPVCDLRPLAAMRRLRRLAIDAELAEPAGLAALTALRQLQLTLSESVDDLAVIAACSRLQDLSLRGPGIANLDFLACCGQLRHLRLSWCANLVEISALAALRQLRSVRITEAPLLRDISPLAGLPQLEDVNVDFCAVGDLGPLASCPELHHLHAYRREPSPVTGLLALARGCPKLRRLELNREAVDPPTRRLLDKIKPGLFWD